MGGDKCVTKTGHSWCKSSETSRTLNPSIIPAV